MRDSVSTILGAVLFVSLGGALGIVAHRAFGPKCEWPVRNVPLVRNADIPSALRNTFPEGRYQFVLGDAAILAMDTTTGRVRAWDTKKRMWMMVTTSIPGD